MSKKIILVLLLIGTLSTALVIFILSATVNAPESAKSGVAKTQPAVVDPNTQNQLTSLAVAKHDSKDDCWTIIDGSVYDLTSYINNHPGGSQILKACGTDGTKLFQQRMNGGEKVGSGTPHSSSAQRQLKELRIGELTN
ncbi:MAG TPA: cytochrome b5-like heme/steroid binding domain-containing protein [Candidatus Saccharibacteria bacterium]|jgi:cytochrome b involved in lipid metabolism|nr:cytochrome b5-like heme/steroid binding domain-containing protein [Candidatus Saccharibacteria bacterium]